MKKLGMIGGFGPESTLEYYRLMIDTYRGFRGTDSLPEIFIYSMDMYAMLRMVEEKQWDRLVQWLLEGINALRNAGADFGIISANTPHIVFDELKALSPIPLISIVAETCKKAGERKLQKVGLLGTAFTMKSRFFQAVFDKNNITMVVPNSEEQAYIHRKLMTEIELGKLFDETRHGLLNIVKRMMAEDGIEGVILGCTELPLILPNDAYGIPFFNTTKIHVESAIKYCIAD